MVQPRIRRNRDSRDAVFWRRLGVQVFGIVEDYEAVWIYGLVRFIIYPGVGPTNVLLPTVWRSALCLVSWALSSYSWLSLHCSRYFMHWELSSLLLALDSWLVYVTYHILFQCLLLKMLLYASLVPSWSLWAFRFGDRFRDWIMGA